MNPKLDAQDLAVDVAEFHSLADAELVRRFQQSSKEIQNEILMVIYDRYRLLILKLCYGYLKNYDLARDILHDVFVKIAENLAGLRNPDILKSWALTITKNLCVDYLRRSSMFGEDTLDDPQISVYSEQRAEDKVIANIHKEKVLEHLKACVQKLKPFDLNVFTLRCQGLRTSGIAELLKVEKAPLRMSYERIKKVLETCMKRKRFRLSIDEIVAIGELDEQ